MNPSFWNLNFGHVVDMVVLIFAVWQFRDGLRKQHEQQVKLHAENQARLDTVLEFQKMQIAINAKRDDEISELKQQTAKLGEIAKGIDRRLVLLENR